MDFRKACLLLVVVVCGATGCRTWAKVGEYQWKIIAPERVNRGEDLVFRIETRDSNGKAVEGISFWWVTDWTSVRGMHHKGLSFAELSNRVKGATGTASIRIYAYDADGNRVQVAKQDLTVE